MSRIIQTITKWLPNNEIEEYNKIFNNCKKLKQTSIDLIERIAALLELFKNKHSLRLQYTNCLQNELHIQELEDIVCTIDVIVDEFTKIFQQLSVNKQHDFLVEHIQSWRTILWTNKRKICYLLERLINEITALFIYYGEVILILTLKISTYYNQLLSDIENNSIICNNTCPYLLLPQRKVTITRLLQIIANNRAEICCHKLIDCLLETYKFYEIRDDNDKNSDSSSLEIYRALTKHLSPRNSPTLDKKSKQQTNIDNRDIDNFTNIEELIKYEEKNIYDLLEIINKITPNLLNSDCIKRSNGTCRIRQKAIDTILEYYQEILWGEVGNYLEHIILWWGNYPLSSTNNSIQSIQNLHEWILQFIVQKNHLPKIIIITLISLTDALCCYITTTLWDQQFRLALITTIRHRIDDDHRSGELFSNVLYDLIMLSNQCEITPDWIIGAPLNELPLVEQIPILHRLDHTIHTIRLWALYQTKRYANNWNVEQFFKITHTDIVDCLSQLELMKFANHMPEIEKGGLDVHVQVCALMRNKLITEIQTNHQNLKETPNNCVECLATVCRTISLANLQLIFPETSYWRIVSNKIPETPSTYVEQFLNQILTPILQAINDHTINNMILKIMCESWLDHIYMNKIKFSKYGALQLLQDFHYIDTWLNHCAILTNDQRQRMLKNEILKRCEGVGRLLLRCPGEQIKMIEQQNKIENEIMPAEMYVPNQEQWLELRATKRKNLFKISLCCNNSL